MFQFLIGSLNTYHTIVLKSPEIEFQFLIGSLNTGFPVGGEYTTYECFNSL